jgi:hypothetical protein
MFGWLKTERRERRRRVRLDRKYLEARSRRFLKIYLDADETRKPQFYRAVDEASKRCQPAVTRLDDDGAGGVLERKIKFPVWFDATSSGGTPMCAGLTKAAEALVGWCDSHPHN